MIRLLDYARLVRLPNAFTAMADICLGALVTDALPERIFPFVFLLLASTLLYSAGMIWNDYFDLEQDKKERPFRPLASGKISLSAARALGSLFLVLGLAFAYLAGPRSFFIALFLVVAILLYDGMLKKTWAGPVLMGLCRFLNVLFGLSVTGQEPGTWGVALALVVGIYIIGVTVFARTEARLSKKNMLMMGASLMLVGLILALTIPSLAQNAGVTTNTAFLFPYLLAGFGCYVGSAVVSAIRNPIPKKVQTAVKRSVLGLVALDAILATALAGLAGLLLLLLLVPAHFLGRWVYST